MQLVGCYRSCSLKFIIRIREFESGEYGLEEATEQIRKLKQELDVRDNQIKELIDSSNLLHQEADLLEQDNLAMKEKLGLSVDDVVRPKGMMARHKEAQTKITMLQKELDECKEVIVNLKLKNRSLSKSTESVKYISSDGEDNKERLMTEVTILKDQRLNFVIEVANFYGTDDELTSLKAENIISKQRAEHSDKMYSLLKGYY
ncbi:PREDICTED: centrosomal protein of 290 kDa-like [Diuraphis noxia]|uniref:centrosomal protein of 290 kDa-like n=1 Tax=Diuraphis noxia TaxID=143948 RepID=UPI000763B821|nr:PREDICTED: centrosomal protein of 290 kDa-like [Diuraphis noxia]